MLGLCQSGARGPGQGQAGMHVPGLEAECMCTWRRSLGRGEGNLTDTVEAAFARTIKLSFVLSPRP